jgi:uncharacterized protein YlbG (UPF0298 family)
MRVLIYTSTYLPIPTLILLDRVQLLVNEYAAASKDPIYIIGKDWPASFVSYCDKIEQVQLVAENNTRGLFKITTNTIIIHFGTNINRNNSIPVLFIPLQLPNELKTASFLQKIRLNYRFNSWMKLAHKIVCVNDWVYSSLKALYPTYSSSLTQVYLPLMEVPSFEWKDLSLAKEQLTSGDHYFLCFAPRERIKEIVKEFSIFKKWQQTTMHLVFVVNNENEMETTLQALKGYKFIQDIAIIAQKDLCLQWIAASYAILLEGIGFSKTTWMEYAMQYEVPLLLDADIALPANWAKAGEVFSFKEKQALSNHFKLYYKDEMYRQAKARSGKEWLISNNSLLSCNKKINTL